MKSDLLIWLGIFLASRGLSIPVGYFTMLEVADLEFLKENAREYPRVGDVLRALHDALAYRRQT